MPTTFNIRIISDPVCPQCYLAKKRLDRAIELYKRVVPDGKHDTFNLTWHAFYLANNKTSLAVITGAVPPSDRVTTNEHRIISCDPKTQLCAVSTDPNTDTKSNESPSIPIQESMARRYGGNRSTATAMQARLRNMGQAEGINFSFGSRIGNSQDAHRLIYLAGEKGRSCGAGGAIQNIVVDALFRRYFEEDGDITSHEMLVEVGTKAGLDGDEVREWLVTGQGGDVVDREAEEAANSGIEGVPVVMINDSTRIDGAQDVEDFLMEFVKIRDGTSG